MHHKIEYMKRHGEKGWKVGCVCGWKGTSKYQAVAKSKFTAHFPRTAINGGIYVP